LSRGDSGCGVDTSVNSQSAMRAAALGRVNVLGTLEGTTFSQRSSNRSVYATADFTEHRSARSAT